MINVEFPAVTLFVDGVTYEPYLVTDDWPIHTSKIDTQLTVGACWQGQCVCLCVHVQGIKEAEIRQEWDTTVFILCCWDCLQLYYNLTVVLYAAAFSA